jgi:hypothetical protein
MNANHCIEMFSDDDSEYEENKNDFESKNSLSTGDEDCVTDENQVLVNDVNIHFCHIILR